MKLLKLIRDKISNLIYPPPKYKLFISQRALSSLSEMQYAFSIAKKRLFAINEWSNLEGINSEFTLHNQFGEQVNQKPQKGYFIKIILPGIALENWVQVSKVREESEITEFTVHPSQSPIKDETGNHAVQHFFIPEASSTFGIRCKKKKNLIFAYEKGKNEKINNKGKKAGERKAINTLIAQGGWMGFQKLQWEKLTDWIVQKSD